MYVMWHVDVPLWFLAQFLFGVSGLVVSSSSAVSLFLVCPARPPTEKHMMTKNVPELAGATRSVNLSIVGTLRCQSSSSGGGLWCKFHLWHDSSSPSSSSDGYGSVRCTGLGSNSDSSRGSNSRSAGPSGAGSGSSKLASHTSTSASPRRGTTSSGGGRRFGRSGWAGL